MSDGLDYIGVKACGCVVAWASCENRSGDLAKTVGAWIRDGLSVERCTTEEARRRVHRCKCVPEQIAIPEAQAAKRGPGRATKGEG